jgi:hypothetical protein
MKYDIEKNLRILSAMVESLTPYLYEGELFGHIGDNLPKLTVGGLLLRLNQLEGLYPALSAKECDQVAALHEKFEALRYEWRTHYEKKIQQELKSRAETMLRYLQDASDAMGDWSNQIEKRTIIAHLEQEARNLNILSSDSIHAINEADAKLRRYFRAGNFYWDKELTEVYPKEDFWWLYGGPDQRD